jgi:DNA-directed RNA polymerase specialized sigma24 family protein
MILIKLYTNPRQQRHLNSPHTFFIRIISRRFLHSRVKRLLASSSASVLPPICVSVSVHQTKSHWEDFLDNLAFTSSMNMC